MQLAARTGGERFRTRVDTGFVTADDAGYVVSADAAVEAYDRKGKRLWSAPGDGRYVVSFHGSLVVGMATRDGASITEELAVYDRKTGHFHGHVYGFDQFLGLGDDTVAYAVAGSEPNLDNLCCSASLQTIDLREGSMRGDPATNVLGRQSRTFDSSSIETHAFSAACLRNGNSQNARIDRIGNGFVFWAAGFLFDVRGPSIRQVARRDECPIGDPGDGEAMLAVHRSSTLDVVMRSARGLEVKSVLPIGDAHVTATLVAPTRLYAEVGDWLYAIDPARPRVTARWHTPCTRVQLLLHVPGRDVIACSGSGNRSFSGNASFDILYGLSV